MLSFPSAPDARLTDWRAPRSASRESGSSRTLSRPQLLTVDEDDSVLQILDSLASQLGFDVESCASHRAALRVLARRPISLAFVDLGVAGTAGVDLLEEIRSVAPACDVVLLGGPGAMNAIDAIKRGAREYLTRPLDPERLRRVLTRFCHDEGARAQVFALEAQIAEQTEYRGMVGRSPAMRGVFDAIERLAPHATHVLISGETGTGKELVAHAFHQAGPRREQPLVMVNGSTLGGPLMDAEFGSAAGGTLFLDEIGELSWEAQVRLLQLLDARPVAAAGTRPAGAADVALVAVTSRDLRADVASGRFHRDLFARISLVEVTLPALRDRREDIPYLIAAFIRECAHQLHKSFEGVTPTAAHRLLNAPWPGNIRELRNLIERACVLADGRVLSERELSGPGAALTTPDSCPAGCAGAADPLTPAALHSDEPHPARLEYLERVHIVDTLRQLGGNRMAAAKALGISRRALYRRLERHHINQPAPRRQSRRGLERRTP